MRRPLLALLVPLLVLPLVVAPASAQTSDGFPVRSSVRTAGDPLPEVRLHGSGWGHGVGM